MVLFGLAFRMGGKYTGIRALERRQESVSMFRRPWRIATRRCHSTGCVSCHHEFYGV